jgi:AraC family transcriptional regulator
MDSRQPPVPAPVDLSGQVLRSRSDAGVRCFEVFYTGGQRIEDHAHRDAFFACSLDGEYRESVAGRGLNCPPRSVVFHPAMQAHEIAFPRGAVRCFVLEFDPREAQNRYGCAPGPAVLHEDGGPLAILLLNAYAEFRRSDSCSGLAIEGIALQAIAVAARNELSLGDTMGRPRWLGRVMELLRECFRSRMTIEEIGAEVGVSPARLSAEFRRVQGRSVAEEQRRLRIEFACRKMRDRGLSLADIAAEAGFSDQAHFCRAFKQVTGLTPARYRGARLS